MEITNASFRVSSWRNVEELHKVYNLIFGPSSTNDDMKAAYLILQAWKIRRSHETLTGILCTLSLLDVHLKDVTGEITDRSTLSTLYASTLTKFINYATSFQMQAATMYKSAYKLGIDSFLIDLRHLCAHGKSMPSLEVFRKSHRYCLNWIKKFFWDKEIENVTDATSRDIRCHVVLASKLIDVLPFYDTLAELLRKKIVNFGDVAAEETTKDRWPTMVKLMEQKKLKNFKHAFKFLSGELSRIIETKTMSLNPRTFIHTMLEQCEYFMQTVEIAGTDEDESDDGSSQKKQKPQTIVNLYQNLVWQLVKHDHLKLLLDMLYQIALNKTENETRRASACFWINTLLKSFRYYQRYCDFAKGDAILQTKITDEVKKVYSYQFDADLKKVFIFAGTQQLPTSLKYSREFFTQLLNSVEGDDMSMCLNLMPFVYPPLSEKQLEELKTLAMVGKQRGGEKVDDKIYSVEDLMKLRQEKPKSEAIWEISTDDIDWCSQPIGTNFYL